MINWNKPIETVDGRKARKIQTVHNELWYLVWVAPEYEGPGDVYMVNAEGCRCDSRSIEMGLQTSQFIRNARVKREGWVRVRREHGAPVIASDMVYSSRKAVEEDCELRGGMPAFITWEE